MSKYEKLWYFIKNCNDDTIALTFAEIGSIAGVPLDHAFLRYKKELAEYGWEVGKISMKAQTVLIKRISTPHNKGGIIR